MKIKNIFPHIFLSFLTINLYANDAITTMSDYSAHAMLELAASPPLILLKNENKKSRHELVGGYIKTKIDDNATLSTGAKTQEQGDAGGIGLGYGYSHSFKKKWAYFLWFQGVQQSGDHEQTTSNVVTTKIKDMEGVNLNMTLGISYEFLRDFEKQTLNLFGGPSLIMFEVSGAIQTYNSSGTSTTAYDGSFDGLLPALTFGMMYEYRFFKNFQIIPYAIGILSLADECQTFRVDNISQTDGNITNNSPLCTGDSSGGDGKTDISPSVLTVGFKFNYIPWDLGFNISGLFRDALLRSDNEERAQVKGVFFSLSKSWGNK